MEIEKISLVAKGANKKSFFLFKSEDQGDQTTVSKEVVDKKVVEKEVTPEPAPAAPVTPDATVELMKEIADLKTRAETAEAEVAKAAELVKAETEKRVQAEYIEKAAQFKALPIEQEKLVDVLRKSGDMEDTLTELFKAVSTLVEKSELLKESGTTKVSPRISEDVNALRARAQEIVKETKCSYSDALSKAIDENPEEYESHVQNMRNKPVQGLK
jgi:hypothetical protein